MHTVQAFHLSLLNTPMFSRSLAVIGIACGLLNSVSLLHIYALALRFKIPDLLALALAFLFQHHTWSDAYLVMFVLLLSGLISIYMKRVQKRRRSTH